MSVLRASSSSSSPSWISMARLVLPSRLALNSPEGSLSEAPLANVSFTTLLYVSPVPTSPSRDPTGTPPPLPPPAPRGGALFEEGGDRGELLPPPVAQRRDPCVDQPGRGVAL